MQQSIISENRKPFSTEIKESEITEETLSLLAHQTYAIVREQVCVFVTQKPFSPCEKELVFLLPVVAKSRKRKMYGTSGNENRSAQKNGR
ncbi:hypothetical protein ACVWYG_002358 [Pedobacter sp. UYEF25]